MANLAQIGRVQFAYATDLEVIEALKVCIKEEGIIPALETTHAFVQAFKDAPKYTVDDCIIINQSGRGDKDIFTVADALKDISWKQFLKSRSRN